MPTPRKPRSDKGLVREVTKLKNLAKKLRTELVSIVTRPEGLDTPATVQAKSAHRMSVALFAGLDKLDGRMKVRFDPSKAGK